MMDMVTGTSLSLFASILGATQGQLGSLASKWLDYKYKLKHLKTDAYLKDIQSARNASNQPFLITRRILAITTALYIFVGPAVASWLQIPIISAYSESNGWLSSIFYGNSTIHWVSAQGYILAPVQTYLTSLTWTMYFGGKNVW